MNNALTGKADVRRAMYHNELGWVEFVWWDKFKGVQHIVKQRTTKDGLSADELYKLLTEDLIETIAKGSVTKTAEIGMSKNIHIENNGYRSVLVKNNSTNNWLLTGFKLNEQVNQSRGATASDLRSNDPIRSRVNEGAAQLELSNLARSGLQLSSLAQVRSSSSRIYRDTDLVKYRADNQSKFTRSEDNQALKSNDTVTLDKAVEASVDKLNRAMVRIFNDDTWSNAYEPADMLSPIADLAKAATKAFGSQISAIKPTSEQFNILNGINLGGSTSILMETSGSSTSLDTNSDMT